MKFKVALLSMCIVANPAFASEQQKALDAIANFAERVCKTAPEKAKSEELELSGKARAELKGLLSKVADLGVEGAAQYKKESEGVLQKDLAGLLSKDADCKFKISEKLIDKLVGSGEAVKAKHPIKLKGMKATTGSVSGLTMTIQIDGDKEYEFNNIEGPLIFSIGELEEGAHTFTFNDIKGYFMDSNFSPKQQISDLSCEGEFTVAKTKTYQIIAWLDGSGLKCDLR